jgi:hypothetical protein
MPCEDSCDAESFWGQLALWPLQVPQSNRVGPMSEFGELLLGMLL